MTTSHVLVPLDGSRLASEALDHALATFDCRITVLNVVTSLDGSMSEGSVLGTDDERLADAADRAERVVADALERAGTPDRRVETAVETGDPAEAILARVEAGDVDHVVMGSHGGDGGALRRRLLGTVSTAVVAEAPVPVTVVR